MAQGLAALTGGVKEGYSAVTDARRAKLIDKALDYEIAERGEGQKSREAAYKRFGKDYASGHEFQPETWGSRFMGWIGGKMGMGQNPQAISANPMQMQAPAAPSYDQMAAQDPGAIDPTAPAGGVGPPQIKHGGAIRHYAHGGRLEETDEERRARYDQAIPRDAEGNAETSGGGALEFAKDLARNVGGNTRRRMSEWAPKGIAADRAVVDAEGAANTGSAVRSNMAEGARGMGQLALGLVEDTSAMSIAKGVGGFLGYGTDAAAEGDEQAAAVKALPTSEKPDDVAANVAAQPTGGGAAAGAGQVNAGASNPATGGQTTGVNDAQTGVEDDQIIDFSQVRDVNPNDMPSKGKAEWEEERNFYAAQAVANGRDPLEAMKQVDAKQMRGFTMYGQQAFQLLRAGDATGAANALYAAYQYFPNGVDVKFGVHKGKDGRPVLIGMGTDEETGEPIKDGKPMVITAESLAAQIENMSNPAAFRTWTKDWQKAEADAREYAEITKPTAQSMATYRAKAGDAALMNAQSRLQEALTSARGGGLDQGDLDRAFKAMNEDADTMALFEEVPPDEADYLKAVMAVAYSKNPGNFPRISQVIKQAYRDGGIEAVDEMVSGGGSGP